MVFLRFTPYLFRMGQGQKIFCFFSVNIDNTIRFIYLNKNLKRIFANARSYLFTFFPRLILS